MSTMIKPLIVKSIYAFVIVIFSVSAFANAQLNTTNEDNFASSVSNADISLDIGNTSNSQSFLSTAESILFSDSSIKTNLQGHYNKVKGKHYMQTNEATALAYFNQAYSQFSGDLAQQYETKLFIGITYYHANKLNLARQEFLQAKTYFENNQDNINLAQVLNNLGLVYYQNGDSRTAITYCQQAYNLNISIGKTSNANKNQANINDISNGQDRLSANKFEFILSKELSDSPIRLGGGGETGSNTTINTSGSGTTTTNGGN